MKKPSLVPFLVAVLCLGLAGCNYDAPLTAKPTCKADARFVGDWQVVDKPGAKEEFMHVRLLDDSTYVASMDNDIYRGFHSDFAGMPFLSVQDLNAPERLYVYMTWEFSTDGNRLTLRTVSNKVILESIHGRSALQKAVKANLKNPALLGEPLVFTRKK